MDYPHPYIAVCLLDGCNKVCKHCYRTAIPSDHGFKLEKSEALLSLDDASSLGTACLFAGGEPTMWQDEDMDFFPFWHELRSASAGWHSCLLACYLEVGSSNKASLGPYQDILARDMVASQKLSDEHEFEELPNRDILKRMSVCGRSPNFFISWGRRYYYCIPHMGYDWFSISELGHLDKDVMESFFQARPIVKEIQKMSIFDVLDKYRSSIKKNVLKEIESMRESIRFAGCSVCLRLCREGVLQDINQRLLN